MKTASTSTTIGALSLSSVMLVLPTYALLFAVASSSFFGYIQICHMVALAAGGPLFLAFNSPSSRFQRPVSMSIRSPFCFMYVMLVTLGSVWLSMNGTHSFYDSIFWVIYSGGPILLLLGGAPRNVSSLWMFIAGAAAVHVVQQLPLWLELFNLISALKWNAILQQSSANYPVLSIVFDHVGIALTSALYVLFDNSSSALRFLSVPLVLVCPAVFFPLYLAGKFSESSKTKKKKK